MIWLGVNFIHKILVILIEKSSALVVFRFYSRFLLTFLYSVISCFKSALKFGDIFLLRNIDRTVNKNNCVFYVLDFQFLLHIVAVQFCFISLLLFFKRFCTAVVKIRLVHALLKVSCR